MGVGRGLEVGGRSRGLNALAISISSSLSVKSLCKSMQLAIEPFLCHC